MVLLRAPLGANNREVLFWITSSLLCHCRYTIRVLGAELLKATTSPCVILSWESRPPSKDLNLMFAVAPPNSWSRRCQPKIFQPTHPSSLISWSVNLDILCAKDHFNILDVRTEVIEGDKGVPEGQPHKGIISEWCPSQPDLPTDIKGIKAQSACNLR